MRFFAGIPTVDFISIGITNCKKCARQFFTVRNILLGDFHLNRLVIHDHFLNFSGVCHLKCNGLRLAVTGWCSDFRQCIRAGCKIQIMWFFR